MTTSFGQLKQAQAKYRSCVNDIEEIKPTTAGKCRARITEYKDMLMAFFPCSGNPLLVPLTSSLYVPGRISDPEHVVIDIGTGYYVKKASPPSTSTLHPTRPISPILTLPSRRSRSHAKTPSNTTPTKSPTSRRTWRSYRKR